MSNFNTSNELATALVSGGTYQGDHPCFWLTKIVLHGGNGLDSEENVVVKYDGKSDWAAVASRIQTLLSHYTRLRWRRRKLLQRPPEQGQRMDHNPHQVVRPGGSHRPACPMRRAST
jgi:hypothetical protein